jgi:solute carrier family 25 uncoupling protein 8/9
MNSPRGRYRGALACAIETGRNEGFLAFYKGFNASFSRLVAWNICLWLTYEQLKKGVLTMYK